MRLKDLLETSKNFHDVEYFVDQLIGSANFDKYDRDFATSGLCGTFALVLYRELIRHHIPGQLVLFCMKDIKSNRMLKDSSGQPYWRHAAVNVGDSYFDVNGRASFSDMDEDYCWGNSKQSGMVVPVSFKELTDILRQHNRKTSGYDSRYRNDWKEKFGNNKDAS